MPDETNVSVETRLGVLADRVERQTEELEKLTAELRRTNDNVATMTTETRLGHERMDRVTGEIWAADNSSRIRTLELHVRGLYALVTFVIITVAGRLAPSIIHYFVYGN